MTNKAGLLLAVQVNILFVIVTQVGTGLVLHNRCQDAKLKQIGLVAIKDSPLKLRYRLPLCNVCVVIVN